MKTTDVPEVVRAVCRQLADAGHLAVMVGGCVRDCLLNRKPNDWDVATSAMPSAIMQRFSRVIPTGLKHGTVTVTVSDEHIEVTTFRADGAYSDGRHPDTVRFGVDLTEDLSRRDFTINAIAFDPNSNRIFDPFGGVEDIQRRVIRCVGRPQDRFSEDGLRMMRAVRFMATLDFQLEDKTKNAITECLDNLKGVSVERLRDELLKLLGAAKPSGALQLAMDTGLLPRFIPGLLPMVGQAQNSHHKWDVWTHTLVTVDHSMRDPVHRMGALLHDIAKPITAKPAYGTGEFSFIDHPEVGAEMAAKIVEEMKFSNQDRERIVTMIRHHMALFHYNEQTSDKTLRKTIKKVGVGALPDLLCLTLADTVGKGGGEDPEARFADIRKRLWKIMSDIASGHTAVSTNQLAINGRDVMIELGIKSGPQVGGVLKTLLDRVMDDPELNTRDILLQMVRQ